MFFLKKVLIAIPALLVGGTEVHVLSLVRVLISGGYRVAICCYYEFDESVVNQFKNAGAEVVLLHLDRSDGRFGFFKIMELIRRLLSIFRKYRPDIVHVQYLAPGLIPIVAGRFAKIPIIFATTHIAGSIVYGRKAKFLLRIAARLCTVFFCVSRGVERFWFGTSLVLEPSNFPPGRKHFTIYNAIDVDRITQVVKGVNRIKLRNSLSIGDRPVVGIVGRLAFQKGHTVLLDAMVEVVKKIPNVVLLIIGDGPDKDSLRKKSKRLKIDKNIFWLGAKKQEEVFELLAIMNVFAMPSLYEGFGLTAAEAMAAGKPVIASDVDGLSEVVENGQTGYLVPSGGSSAMAKRLVELLSHRSKAQAMGEAGRQRVKQHFSLERFAEATLTAYQYFS